MVALAEKEKHQQWPAIMAGEGSAMLQMSTMEAHGHIIQPTYPKNGRGNPIEAPANSIRMQLQQINMHSGHDGWQQYVTADENGKEHAGFVQDKALLNKELQDAEISQSLSELYATLLFMYS